MKTVFADTLYWVAVVRPNDPWAEPARRARASLTDAHLVTTDEVLSEFLTALSQGGPHVRIQAARMVHAIQTSADVTVIPQAHDGFQQGLDLYEQRPDKGYSLVDCISMCVMRSHSITEILTNDHHFTQEGFTILIQPS